MKYTLIRSGKDGTFKRCKCTLRINMDRSFVVRFDETTPDIGLNDGNFHSIKELNGTIHDIIVDHEGIWLERCFVKIGNAWHRDGFLFRFTV